MSESMWNTPPDYEYLLNIFGHSYMGYMKALGWSSCTVCGLEKWRHDNYEKWKQEQKEAENGRVLE